MMIAGLDHVGDLAARLVSEFARGDTVAAVIATIGPSGNVAAEMLVDASLRPMAPKLIRAIAVRLPAYAEKIEKEGVSNADV